MKIFKNENIYNHFSRCRQSVGQYPTLIHDKNSQQTGNRGELTELDKEHLQKL